MTPFKRHRLAKGLTLAQLAQRIGVSVPAVHTWEVGRSCPSPKYFPKLARVLDVDPMELTGFFASPKKGGGAPAAAAVA